MLSFAKCIFILILQSDPQGWVLPATSSHMLSVLGWAVESRPSVHTEISSKSYQGKAPSPFLPPPPTLDRILCPACSSSTCPCSFKICQSAFHSPFSLRHVGLGRLEPQRFNPFPMAKVSIPERTPCNAAQHCSGELLLLQTLLLLQDCLRQSCSPA